MLAAYGVDVLDPAVSLRRVHVLLERLPPHARRLGEQWSTESELLAGLVDRVAYLTYVTLRANGAKDAKVPEPIARPAAHAAVAQGPPPEPDRGLVAAASWAEGIAAIAATEGVQVRHG
jgi:hypothetical protein